MLSLLGKAFLRILAAIRDLVRNPEKWKQQSAIGIDSAPLFSYEKYLISLNEMFLDSYGDRR